MKRGRKTARRVWTALLALLLLFQSGAFPQQAEAKKKELTLEPGYYVRWKRGLPPQDGKWYRTMIVATDYVDYDTMIRGNTVYEVQKKSMVDSRATTGQSYLNDGQDVLALVSDKNVSDYTELSKKEAYVEYFDMIDLDREIFYTQDFMNTPLLRYESTAGPRKNGINPYYGNAPYYSIRLSDWSEGDGVPQNQYLTYDPSSLRDNDGDPLYAFRVTDKATPWFFSGNEHESTVDRYKYVIGNLQNDNNSGTNIFIRILPMAFPADAGNWYGTSDRGYFPLLIAFKSLWSATEEFYVYYGEKVSINAIRAGQEITNGEVVSFTGDNLFTLAVGSTMTVKDGGVLSVGSTFFNDGIIKVEKGGTLIVREGGSIMPWNTANAWGNIVCDGGDVIVFSGGRCVLNGSDGLRVKNGTVYNYGAILTKNIDIRGLANSFHNYGAVMAGWTVQSDYAQKFRDEDLSIANGTLSSSYLKNNKGGLYAVGGEVVTGTGFSYNQ